MGKYSLKNYLAFIGIGIIAIGMFGSIIAQLFFTLQMAVQCYAISMAGFGLAYIAVKGEVSEQEGLVPFG